MVQLLCLVEIVATADVLNCLNLVLSRTQELNFFRVFEC